MDRAALPRARLPKQSSSGGVSGCSTSAGSCDALNEHVARRANVENDCKERFWEGRFRSQALLLDEAELLTAMAYVDLNPIRAGIAATPEASVFTSIYERIRDLKGRSENPVEPSEASAAPVPLMEFESSLRPSQDAIPFDLLGYIELVDWSGRRIAEGKRGAIEEKLPSILRRLNIDVNA